MAHVLSCEFCEISKNIFYRTSPDDYFCINKTRITNPKILEKFWKIAIIMFVCWKSVVGLYGKDFHLLRTEPTTRVSVKTFEKF